MKTSPINRIPQAIFCTTFLLLWTISCNTKPDIHKEEQKIREVWNGFTNSLCNGDWESFSKVWDHSTKVSVVHPHIGEWLTGWEEVQHKYEKLLDSDFRCTLKKNNLSLYISNSGDMAWGTVDLIVEFNDSSNTTNHPWQTVVFEKIKGEWKLVYLLSTLPKLE